MTPDEARPVDDLSADEREVLAHLLGESPALDGPIVGRGTDGLAPLSFSQRRLWVAEQLKPGDPAYHLWVAFRATGTLDRVALAKSLAGVVARHEILRSTIEVIDGEPNQRVHPPFAVELPVTDLRDVPVAVREAHVLEATRAEAQGPFDLAQGPLLRARLLHLSIDEHILVLAIHHIVTDGWSMGVLFRELGALYDGFRSGRPSLLQPLPIQYGDFAAWQRQRFAGRVAEAQVGEWRRDLEGMRELQLEGDRPRTAHPGSDGAAELAVLPHGASSALDVVARHEGATRFMALLAVFSVLLSRYAAQRDVLVGVASAGRGRAELEPLVGLFVNLLPLRTVVEPHETFRQLLRRVRSQSVAAFDRQEVPFDRLLDSLNIERTLDRHPLFQVVFTAQDALLQPLRLADLVLTPVEISATSTRFDLEAHVLDARDGVRLGFVYSAARFEAPTIRRMLGHYVALVERCAAQPDLPLSGLPWMSADERGTVDAMSRGREVDPVDSEPAVTRMVAQQVAVRPDSLAVVCGETRISYSGLDRRANQVARWLHAQGVARGDRVGVLCDRTAEFVVAILGSVRAGAAYVPLDPTYPDERLAYMLQDSGMRVALTSQNLGDRLASTGVRTLRVDAADRQVGSTDNMTPAVAIGPDDVAYVVYTSGSTGRPKGVEVTHGALGNLVRWHVRAFDVTSTDCATQIASVGFDACVWEIWPYLAAGARVCLADDEIRTVPERLWQWLRAAEVTIAFLPTPLAEAALRVRPPEGLRLRTLLTGGDRLTLEASAAWPFVLVNNYGPTENAVVTTSSVVSTQARGKAPSIGGPIDHVQTYVLDEGMDQVPLGVVGELYVGGRSLARGYLGRPGQTAGAFVPDPFGGAPGARLYRTGDLVRWCADGTLDFVGRRDGQVKVRGFRIELGEVEAALARVSGVAGAVAALHGAGDQRRIVGYVVAEAECSLVGDEVRARVKPWLPPYMVPAAVVVLPSLPLTAHGKVDRAALPAPAFEEAATGTDGPRTPVEATLQRIWCEVLRLERIGVHDNFFDVGGDSILSIQIASRATQAGLPLSPRLFFEHQTIADLATRVAPTDAGAVVADGAPGDAAGPVIGPVPVTPIAQWFFDQRVAEPSHFNQAVLLELRQPLEAAAVVTALETLVTHHDVLRSRVSAGPRGPEHRIDPPGGTTPLSCVDVSSQSAADQTATMTSECARAQASLDLAQGPVVRAVLFRRGHETDRHDRLLIVAHHLIVDGVSWRILLEDLYRALNAAVQGVAVRLPFKTTSFKAWAEGLGDFARAVAPGVREFWLDQAGPVAPFPLDDPAADPAANTAGGAAHVSVRFSREETTALLREVPAATGFRINETLLASVVHAIASWAGRSSVHVDVEGHGREAIVPGVDVSRTVGWFTSLYPMRFDLGERSDVSVVSAVAARLRTVPHGGVEYGVLRYLHPDPDLRARLSASPRVSFNYLGQFDDGGGQGLFGIASEDSGPSIGPPNRRAHWIEVNARVVGGMLHVDWTYCPALHTHATVEGLAASSARLVRSIAALPAARVADRGVRLLATLDDASFHELSQRFEAQGLEDVYPLGPLQHGMVAHALGAPGTGTFVSQFEIVLDAQADPSVMHEAWASLQARHPILRTAFVETTDGGFRQAVLGRVALDWTHADWSGLSDEDAGARFDAFRQDDRLRGFEIGNVPLRVALIQLRARRAHLVWTHHHALLDGWSVAMLLDELFQIHEAVSEGRVAALAPRPPYRRYVEWLQERDNATTEAFWRSQLAGVTAPTVLASDRTPGRQARRNPRVEERELSLSSDATRLVGEFATRHRLTLNTVVQGAWALLLSRHSGDDTVVFGTAVSGRPAELEGVEQMVGLFLNGVPLRADVTSGSTVHEWLGRLQLRHADVRQHQHAALSDIQRWSSVGAGQPLFDATMAFENYPISPTLSASARRMGIVDFRLVAHTSASLHLRVVPGERLRLMLGYDAARFEPALTEEMLRQIESILRQMAERPTGTIGDIALGSAVPQAVVAASGPSGAGVHEDILAVAAQHLQRVAVHAGGRSHTYEALDRASGRVASALAASGVAHGEVVGVYLRRGIDLVASLIGVLRVGGAFAILDPDYPVARTLDRLRIAGARRVVCTSGAPPAALADWQLSRDDRVLIPCPAEDDDQRVAAGPTCVSAVEHDLAYLAFTSGSTGQPKGVLGRHGALAAYGSWLAERFGVGPSDRFTMLTALSHDPLLRDIFPALQVGGTLCVPDDETFGRPGALAAWAASSAVTVANLTPSMAQLLVEGASTAIESLRLALFVGEPLTRALVDRFKAVAPNAAVVNLYGATETQQSLGYYVVPPASSPQGRSVLPVGDGLPGVDLLVVREGGQVAGIGEVGEIWVRSQHLAGGYVNDPTLTATRFVSDPFGPGSGRAYRTGDRGWRAPAGEVGVLGRADDQVKVRGFRVELAEVEGSLLRLMGVREAAVALVRRDDGEAFLVAGVTGEADPSDLLERLSTELPVHLVPARIITVDRLPRTGTGKVDRRALAAMAEARIDAGRHVAPRSPVEVRLADLWADVLRVERVGLHDSFFELGGHSILGARLAARVREAFAVEVHIADIFRHPRFADLAALVSNRIVERESAVGTLLDELAELPEDELRALLDGAASPGQEPRS